MYEVPITVQLEGVDDFSVLSVGVLKGQGEIALDGALDKEGTLNIQDHINNIGEDIYTETEVIAINLNASILNLEDNTRVANKGELGIVTGSITLGQTGLRASTIEVITDSVFYSVDEREG